MSKIWGYYNNKLDKTWFDSSNVKYAECIDNENNLKTLKVVFNNGTQYQYNEVKVQDYLLFREDLSQGKALNKFIKGNGYKYEKLGDANLESLDDELEFRMKGGVFVNYSNGTLKLLDSTDTEIFNKNVDLNLDAFNAICGILVAVGKDIYVVQGVKEQEDKNKELVEEALF